MILGIDASRAVTGQRTGTEAYAYFLIRALIPFALSNGHWVRVYYNQRPEPGLFAENGQVETVIIPRNRLWTHTRLKRELEDRRPDVFFTPAHVIPWRYGGPSVATVHDLGYEYFPETHPRRQLAYLRWSTRHNARVARRVIADSQATRDDLTRLYDVAPEKVDVIYPGIDPDVRRIDEVAQITSVRDKYEIGSPYLLFLGTLQPRKNLTRLVEAFGASGLHDRGFDLVLAGRSGWLARPLLDTIAEQPAGVSDHIRVTGYIGETEKNALLSGATALLFPSLHEGFGFPVLEAQACGTPVVCSNTSSLPEVAGKGAILVDPQDVEALGEAMRRVVEDEGLRSQLVVAGRANLARFTWEATAARVLETLEQAMGHSGQLRQQAD